MEHFTHYFRGRHFALYTDHKPLVNLQAVHTKALSQIQEAILKYDFEIIHQKGSEMPAYFLSQNVVSQLHQNRINSLKFDDQKLELDEVQEPWIKDIKDWMMTGTQCKTTSAISYMKNYWNRFLSKTIYYGIHGEPTKVCMVLPYHKIANILYLCCKMMKMGGLMPNQHCPTYFF
jgi:hypothetical protein